MDGGGRTTSQACGLIQALAYAVVRPLSAHGHFVEHQTFHLDEGLHPIIVDLRQVEPGRENMTNENGKQVF